jgi:hypothetical protein
MKREANVRLVEFGAVKAFVTVTYGDMEIRGFRIIDHEGGNPWVSLPSKEIQKDGEKQYFNMIWFPDPKKKKEFADWLLDEYTQAVNADSCEKCGQHNVVHNDDGSCVQD